MGWLRRGVQRWAEPADAPVDRAVDPADLDPLTGLWNRSAWEDALTDAVARAATRSGGTGVHVGVLDLDAFAAYNSTHGRAAGDDVLRECARLFSATVPGAVLARWGGEEFTVLLTGPTTLQALAVFEDLRAVVPGIAAGLTASAGVAGWDGAEVPLSVLARADAALGAAKRAGGDRTFSAGTGAVGGSGPAALRGPRSG